MIESISQVKNGVLDFYSTKHPEFFLKEIVVSPASDLRHGDLTTNAAMSAFAHLKASYPSPRDLAQAIVDFLNTKDDITSVFSKIEVAGPGFVNFWYSPEYLGKLVGRDPVDILALNTAYKGKRVMTEFTDPNPFKEFHIGHLYSNIVGESISRILEANGAEVKRVCYQGDIGMHVAKSVYGILQKFKLQNSNFKVEDSLVELGKQPLEARVKFLGEAYALGAQVFEEDQAANSEIVEINKKVFSKDPETMAIYEVGRKWSLEYFDSIYARLGTDFWKFYFESEVGEKGKELVLEYLKKGVFEESEGAIIFPGEKYGLHNRVFINSLGLPTYEAKELGLAPAKYADYKFDLSIMVTGNEIDEYFRVLLKALSMIYPEIALKTLHISHGMVRLPSGKMSSRTGNVVTGESLLDEADQKAALRIGEIKKEKNIDVGDIEETARIIGDGAVKYALLKNNIGGDVIFNFDDVVNFEGNSGPYLQYTYVRTLGVLNNSEFKIKNSPFDNAQGKKIQLKTEDLEKEENELLRYLVIYPYVVEMAGVQFAPSHVATYLYNLSQYFNAFYQKHKVVGSPNEEFRLALVASVGDILKNGLNLLGIETVERM